MILWKLSSRLDKIDPYWYSRLIGLKAAYIAVGLFIANMILKPAQPSLTMLFSAAGICLIEMPTINDVDKKDNIYLGYFIIMSLTLAIFASTSFLKLSFVIVVALWAYVLYFALRRQPELFAIVSVLLMLATIGQEGINVGNYFMIWDSIIFIAEFALISFWLHKLFPFMYHKIWLSSILRQLESISEIADKRHVGSLSLKLRRHAIVSQSSINLLKKRNYAPIAKQINEGVAGYHYYLYHILNDYDVDYDFEVIANDFDALAAAIQQQVPLLNYKLVSDEELANHNTQFMNIVTQWNQLCVHVNN